MQLNQTNFELSHQLSAAQQELASKAKEIDDSESRRKFAEDRLREMRLRDEHVSQRRVVCPLYVVLCGARHACHMPSQWCRRSRCGSN